MRKNIILICLVFATVLLVSCEKSDTVVSGLPVRGLRVFNDTTLSSGNDSYRVASGNGRIYMSYADKAPYTVNGGSVFLNNYKVTILAAEENGTFLWKVKAFDDLDIGDILPMPDNGFVVTAAYVNLGPFTSSYKHFFIKRFDENGNVSSADSILLPAGISTDYYFINTGARLLPNGNLLVFGTILDANSNFAYKGFAGEVSLSGIWVWSTTYKLLNIPVETTTIVSAHLCADGNYVFSGTVVGASQPTDTSVFLLKTNVNGDTLWSSRISGLTDPIAKNVIEDPNGRLYVGYNSKAGEFQKAYITSLSPSGEVLNTLTLSPFINSNIASIAFRKDGNVFGLLNQTNNTYVLFDEPVFTQKNSQYAIAGSELNLIAQGYIQFDVTDLFAVSCRLSDGRTACYGFIQPDNRTYYQPALMIID